MASVAQFSDFKNFIKLNNKIPHYAENYKKEYLYIIGLNYEFLYFVENRDKIYTYKYFHNFNIDRIIKLIKIFLKGQKKGKFKNISGLYFRDYDIQNILFFKNIAINYFSFKYKSYYNFDLHNHFFYIFNNLKYIIDETEI